MLYVCSIVLLIVYILAVMVNFGATLPLRELISANGENLPITVDDSTSGQYNNNPGYNHNTNPEYNNNFSNNPEYNNNFNQNPGFNNNFSNNPIFSAPSAPSAPPSYDQIYGSSQPNNFNNADATKPVYASASAPPNNFV